MTSTSQIAVFQLMNEIMASVNTPARRPAWKNAKGMPRNPVPRTKLTIKKKPMNMFTVFGRPSLPAVLSARHSNRSVTLVHTERRLTFFMIISRTLQHTSYIIRELFATWSTVASAWQVCTSFVVDCGFVPNQYNVYILSIGGLYPAESNKSGLCSKPCAWLHNIIYIYK